MRKIILFLIFLCTIVFSLHSQQKEGGDNENKDKRTPKKTQSNAIPPIIRDIDISKFQRNKIYLSFLDEDGNPITDLDSSDFFIIEKETGEKVNPSAKIFYDSDEGMLICFAMDASLSMSGSPLENVKKGLLNTISKFRDVDKMGLAYFHDKFYKKCEFGTDREVLRNNINELSAGGSYTVLFESVISAIDWLNKQKTPKRKILIIISDGEDNGSENTLDDCIKEIQKSDISVFTIGSIRESEVMKGTLLNLEKLAKASKDGNYYKINTPEDISRIIPLIYDRIKDEYLLEYWSYAKPKSKINLKVEIKYKNTTYTADTVYTAPESIVENAPSKSFFKTKEFLYGSIGVGVILVVLIVFLILNILKKKKFKLEKEREAELRRKEAEENKQRYNQLYAEYENLLSQLEKQSSISEEDKQTVIELERKLTDLGKTIIDGGYTPIDTRRRTQILDGKEGTIPEPNYQVGNLIVIEGQNKGNRYTLYGNQVVIGRVEGDIIISENIVSRRHALIYKQGNNFVIEDLKSTNGTFVNGYKVTSYILKNGDIIKIGNTKFQFSLS